MSSFASLAADITTEYDKAYQEAEVREGGWVPDDGTYTVLITGFTMTPDLTFGLVKGEQGKDTPSVPAFGISVTCTMTGDPSSPEAEPRSFRPKMIVLPKNFSSITDPDRRKYLNTLISKTKGMLKCILDREPAASLMTDLVAADQLVTAGVSGGDNVPPAVEIRIATKNGYQNFYWNKRVS
jgi:hypothetical protein